MRGWFDAFREDGGPTLYAYHNRTPVAADVPALALAAAALTLYLAFLVVFPGIRKERFSTFATVTLSLFVGTVILVCRHGSCWHVARATVARASYRAYSGERLSARVAVHVGLDHVNVTLRAVPDGNSTLMNDVDFNEQFAWAAAGAMAAAYNEALRRGLPYPVLTVAEYFALGQEGFDWGGRYRAAGYFATTLLWTCLALWMLMNLLVVVVPRYGAYAMCATGALLAGAAGGYWALLPRTPLTIVIEGVALTFALGWCFWLVLIAGCICVVSGAVISIVDVMYPHRFSTVLEVDYDTPYDRHVLIEDSEDHKKRARPAHAAQSLPTRILRRLSSKTRESEGEERLDSSTVSIVNESGRDNPAFERERAPPPAPKSPWRYPLFRRQLPHPMDRADSASSFASSCAGAIKMSQLATSPSNIPHRLRPQNPATERVKDMW